MSKLKVAKVVYKSLTVGIEILKWLLIVAAVGGIGSGLWAWAGAHFLSFAIVIGILGAIFGLAGIITAWDWSEKVIKEAKEEERRAQERNRVEKERKENPGKYVPSFEDNLILRSDHAHGYR